MNVYSKTIKTLSIFTSIFLSIAALLSCIDGFIKFNDPSLTDGFKMIFLFIGVMSIFMTLISLIGVVIHIGDIDFSKWILPAIVLTIGLGYLIKEITMVNANKEIGISIDVSNIVSMVMASLTILMGIGAIIANGVMKRDTLNRVLMLIAFIFYFILLILRCSTFGEAGTLTVIELLFSFVATFTAISTVIVGLVSQS